MSMTHRSRLGVMGGTFDPIHIGHLVSAQLAAEAYGLHKVIFIPAGQPPHKRGRLLTPAEHRYAMVKAAIADNERFMSSRIEIDRKGPSFTIDTMSQLKQEYPDNDLFFITGTDAIAEVFTWKAWPNLFDACEFIICARPGTRMDEFTNELSRHGEDTYHQVMRSIHILEMPQLDVSSTDIRWRLKTGLSVRYIVTPGVISYIIKNGLYS